MQKKIQFQVCRDGAIIFKKPYLSPVDRRYADPTALAISEFQIAHPGVLLTDDNVTLKWADTSAES